MPRIGPLILLVASVLGFATTGRAQEVSIITSSNAAPTDQSVPLWRLPVDVSVSLNAGYDENANTTANNSEGSLFTGANVSLNYNFGTERTRASLSTGTGVTYYPDLDDNRYDPDLNLTLSVNHRVNLRLALIFLGSASYRAEADFSSDLGSNRRGGNYFTTNDSISGSYQWLPRFSTVTGYSFGTVVYDTEDITVGQDRTDHGFTQSFRFLYLPVTTVVADFRYSMVHEGRRGSDSQFILAGLDHTFSPLLQATFRAGVQFYSSEGVGFAQDTNQTSPNFQGSLTYALGEKTSVNWNASYSIEESDVLFSPGRKTFRTGLTLSYAFTRRISSSLTCYYSHDMNDGADGIFFSTPSFSEDSVDVALNLRYAMTHYLSATVGYNGTVVESELAMRSYTRNRYSAGLSFNF